MPDHFYSFIRDLAKKDPTVYMLYIQYYYDRSISYDTMLSQTIIHLTEERDTYRTRVLEYTEKYE